MTIQISEFLPNPNGSDPSQTTIELTGTAGENFSGVLLAIESDGFNGTVDRLAQITGTFDANGLLTASIPDFENPSFTIVLVDAFNGSVGDDLDVNDDGTITASLTALGITTVHDAIGVPDSESDEGTQYGVAFGGVDFAFTGDEPRLIFRDSASGALFAVNDPDSGEVIDVNGNSVDPALFDFDPTEGTDTFGSINPSIGGDGEEPVELPDIVINEVDADNPSTDSLEFIELFGAAGTSLDGLSLVLFNGSDDLSYDAIDLDGFALDDSGFFVVGSAEVENVDLVAFTTNGIQNGADAVALIFGDAADFPNDTAVPSLDSGSVIDVVIYDTNDSDDTGLLQSFGRSAQFNEDANGDKDNHSNSRNPDGSGTFVAQDPTPGESNVAPIALPNIVINEVDADQTGTDAAEFIELFGEAGTSLDGLSLVLYNGSDDASYNAIDLDGHALGDDGFFVVGSASVPNVDLAAFTTNGIQNGADAVALVVGNAADFPTDTPVATLDPATLVDAIVYGTSDSDDAALLAGLGETTQFNDTADGSISRTPDASETIVTQEATPGATNDPEIDPPVDPVFTLISEIQGSSDFSGLDGFAQVGVDDVSALDGSLVTIEAIVTADMQDGGATSDLNGFFVQEELADQDDSLFTSEGLFIFDGSAPAVDVAVGDKVRITGTVSEFFGMTQLTADDVTIVPGEFTVPPAVEVDFASTGTMLDDGGDFVIDLEAYESMLITIPTELSVTEMFNLDRFGEYRVSEGGQLEQFTQNNDPSVEGYTAHLEDIAARSIIFDDGRTDQNPEALEIIDGNDGVLTASDSFRMGDTITNATGVVNYSFDEFRLQDATGDYSAENPRPDAPELEGNFKVASLNVLNYFTTLDDGVNVTDTGAEPRGADDLTAFSSNSDLANTVADAEFQRQQTKIVNAIVEMDADVLGLVEVENAVDSAALAALTAAVNVELGSEVYGFINTGLAGGDAIANGIMYKLATANPLGDVDILDTDAFIDPLNAGTPLNRAAVNQTFEHIESGEVLTISVNHLKSKGSLSGLEADNAQGDGQGNNNATRTEAAKVLEAHLATNPTGVGDSDILILGDLNAYASEDPVTALLEAGYTDLAKDALGGDAYSYVFDGQIGTLDYILSTEGLLDNVTGVAEWHINADEADAIDYNLDFGRPSDLFDGDTAARNSDHDPVIVAFQFDAPEPEFILVEGTSGNDRLIGTDANERFESLGGRSDQMTGGLGADQFVFGAETSNRSRERDIIRDYEVGVDEIILTDGTVIGSIRENGSGVTITFEGDSDTLSVYGRDLAFDDLTIVIEDEFILT